MGAIQPVLAWWSHSARRRDLILAAVLFAVTLFAYYPALHGELLLDDDVHVTRPELRSLTGLGRIWGEVGVTQQYYPVLHSMFWLEHQVWGEAVLGYHIANVLLHVGAALLVVAIMRRLQLPGGWFAAFLFALHPVAVESVAWISERKNTLSTVFYLGAALAFLRFRALKPLSPTPPQQRFPRPRVHFHVIPPVAPPHLHLAPIRPRQNVTPQLLPRRPLRRHPPPRQQQHVRRRRRQFLHMVRNKHRRRRLPPAPRHLPQRARRRAPPLLAHWRRATGLPRR